jgi:hypothetical protein
VPRDNEDSNIPSYWVLLIPLRHSIRG